MGVQVDWFPSTHSFKSTLNIWFAGHCRTVPRSKLHWMYQTQLPVGWGTFPNQIIFKVFYLKFILTNYTSGNSITRLWNGSCCGFSWLRNRWRVQFWEDLTSNRVSISTFTFRYSPNLSEWTLSNIEIFLDANDP